MSGGIGEPSQTGDSVKQIEASIGAKLERGRTELLDLSTRNRLISTPRNSKYARTIEVVDELSSEVYRLLVRDGRAFTFSPGRLPSGATDGDTELLDEDFAPLAQPDENEPVDERGVAQRHSDTKLQTQLTSTGLQKRLLSLYYDARTLQEEQGVNILYLALGMLKWFEAPNSNVERYAPLLLVPVMLERGSARERFKLCWTQEDPQPNLSLAAMLRREHGIVLPEFDEDEDFDPAEYARSIAAAVGAQQRWEVLTNDIVLGFFSFSKFLMYRDLDPENWPKEKPIDGHDLINRLLGDGFTASDPGLLPIADDDPIDPHIAPSAMVHVVDADSSQTVAIEEARRGRNLVIQGPPGTGKSQTIANVIAAAVADGKKVLFVAEKMAALEVVKRRLDNVGIGDICFELHSNKANKRAVLEELKRTWDLGRPRGADDRTAIRKLEAVREILNAHATRLHRPFQLLNLSPYHVIGHLVRLQRAGVQPSDIRLEGPEAWSPADKTEREQMLLDLSGRLADIGLPKAHPWRGVGLDAVLRMDIDRYAQRIATLRERLRLLLEGRERLEFMLEMPCQTDNANGVLRLAQIGAGIAEAPADIDADAIGEPCWDQQSDDLRDLVDSGAAYFANRAALDGKVAEAAWTVPVDTARQHLAAYGSSWLRWLKGDYRQANATFRALLSAPPPKTLQERLQLLDSLIAVQKAAADLARDDAVGRRAFGLKWRRERSDWEALRRTVEWSSRYRQLGLGSEFRRKLRDVTDRQAVGRLAGAVSDLTGLIQNDLEALIRDLRLDLISAFGVGSAAELDLRELFRRLEVWLDRAEDLSKWIAYRGRAEQASNSGLGDVVARLADGRIDVTRLIDHFEMAFYEAVLRHMVAEEPELARFDGDAHERLVQEFRELDHRRIELARLEVAGCHHEHLPKTNGAAGVAGPLGVLRGEMARKRGHIPIRQLMRRAGPAIQALKPVFMMSPLSIAQFLAPGTMTFDVLVIDEASQIEPVDALGAVARCNQIVVVGDDRQLPPTRFFAKITEDGDNDDDQEGAAGPADIESILGLCNAKGVPTRMLRWHYRSRHQSLIAVSNSQFYENKLYIVPSPWCDEAATGLRFNHVPNGVFDSGNTATNATEAKVVAEAILHHAKTNPELSLGVAAFSVKQRRAIQDELERLRRLNPDTEDFFNRASAEPFFVKNLENVQGDERDVIFISVGYGRNAQGYMAMRFGPLSAEGGERRLNVLISRAKRRCEVFSSITDEDIDLERGRGKGVAAFKLFLHFARTGKMSIGLGGDREHDSLFEEEVANALRADGYDVRTQIGIAGFFVDLAVVDPEKPGRYVIGIECDGASYHSSRSARDRDRLRQAVLEDHGWIIHRIWSTDWFQRPQEQLRRTVAAIEVAKAQLATQGDTGVATAGRAVPVEIVDIDRGESAEISLSRTQEIGKRVAPTTMHYREATLLLSVSDGMAPHEVSVGTMADAVRRIVSVEGPIHRSEIVARVRGLWGLQRAGNRIQAAVQNGLDHAVVLGKLTVDGEFYSIPGAEVVVRDRSGASSASLRRPEMLPPMEIRKAMMTIVEQNFGATGDQLALLVARAFGFKATSAQLRAVIDNEIEALRSSGKLAMLDGVLRSETAGMGVSEQQA
jgi:very-short-patch-repair endonuclease